MKTVLIGLLFLFMLDLPAHGDELSLFFIQRSKNNNEVHYQLHVDEACQIASEEPVTGSWKLLEEGSDKTAPLSAADRMAYGVVKQTLKNNWLYFNIRALKTRAIRATAKYNSKTNQCLPIVQTKINAKWASLHHVYVRSEETFLIPNVIYIEVLGQSLESIPRQVVERIEN